MFEIDTFQKIFSIVIVDLVLSGDNAVVIGMAARNLDERNRRRAIIWGGAAAVGLRIVFTVMAALLLDVPLLQAIGGIALIAIAFKLINPEQEVENHEGAQVSSFGSAVRTIVLADVVMSLDNILAVGGTAEGHLWLLLFGLGLSIPLLLIGSSFVARIMHSAPWLLILGVLVLIHAGVSMLLHDNLVEDFTHFHATEMQILLLTIPVAGLVIGAVRVMFGRVAGITNGTSDTPGGTAVGH